MKAQHKYSMDKQRMQQVTMMVGLTLVALIGSLFVLMQQAQGSPMIRQPSFETSVVARPSTNRIFQDEINAARVTDVGNLVLPNYSWPERLSDVRRGVVIARRLSVPHVQPASINRIFLDEIVGAQTMNGEAMIPPFGELTTLHGPR
jgi:hypothetical protein